MSTLARLQPLLRRRSRLFWIVFFVLLVLAGVHVARLLVLSYDEKNWDAVLDAKCAQDLATAEAEFNNVQRAARRVATGIGQRSEVQNYLTGRTTDRVALFDLLGGASSAANDGIELYDKGGTLVAWGGRSGPSHRREVRIALDGQWISYVDRTPISSQLFVVIPVHDNGKVLGAVLVRSTIEVAYPLNNAYFNREGLAEELTRELGVTVEFNFTPNAAPQGDGRTLETTLFGIDSSKVGVVTVLRPVRSAFFESVGSEFQVPESVLLVILLAIAAAEAARRIDALGSLSLRVAGMIGLIWAARYALLWLDVPSGLVNTGIFDPSYFASPFGGGLTKSIGEMTLTSFALAASIWYAGVLVLRRRPGGARPRFLENAILRFLMAVVATFLLFWLLRGYGAVVRSAVFDSTLRFADPQVIFPSFELGIMLLNLFLISSCMIVVLGGTTVWVHGLLGSSGAGGSEPLGRWLLTALLFAAAAVAFGPLQEHPLMSVEYRLLIGACALGLAFHMHHEQRIGKTPLGGATLLLAIPFTVLLYYPLLDANVHEHDRQRVEVLAEEVLRPVDSWFDYLVDEGLKSFITDETVDLLARGDEEEIHRLAFARWAQSAVCREGYTSVFAVTDSDGREISRFAIGGQATLASRVDTTMGLPRKKVIRVKGVGEGVEAMKIYAGSIPIETPGGALVGFGKVVVAAGQQTLFRGENPAILRGASPENLESFYRAVTVSEFRRGVLLTTNDMGLPIGYALPEQVTKMFTDSLSTAAWVEETVDGSRYESYYVRHLPGNGDVVALSLHELGLVWRLIGIVKTLLYNTLILLAVLCVVLLVRWRRGVRYVFTFRDRLLGALLLTALVPLGSLLLYGRVSARARLMESTGRRLQDETATIVANVAELPAASGAQQVGLTQAQAEDIAGDAGEDFNLYVGNQLQVSSRPELYEAGILDTRLSGSAFANVLLGGSRFYLETESIGMYEYAVGYRPVLNAAGEISGVVSVPTLYRQDQLEEDISRRNAFLFTVYTIVLLSVILLAAALANRIAAPIQRLTEATRRVSRGDLTALVPATEADGEIGELVRSFDAMISDLQRSREELIRAQRELAWKEMAKQVAHEIKNPLTPMKLAVQHLRQTYADRVPDFDRVLDEVTRTVIDQIEALSRIASEFSAFARMPKRQVERCDLKEVLAESVQLFERDANVLFTTNLGEGRPAVLADREELRRAFINIIRNAIQAMNNTGKIAITLRPAGNGTEVIIRDFGPGIPEEVQAKLFQPNFSTKTDGMGLGLAIVKKTIDDIGGNITIESARGEGTTVAVFLPSPPDHVSGA